MRGKRIDSLLGSLRFWRHYYHCAHCHQGCFPRDLRAGLGTSHLTPAANEVASLAGVQSSFAQAAERNLQKLAGLRLSESTVERATEAAGQRVGRLLHEKVTFGESEHWKWQRDAQGQRCSYVSLDATGVRQQGPDGAKADGRMAYVGMVYNVDSEHDAEPCKPHSVRYLAGFYSLDELGLQLRCQAAQVGWDEADQQIALSDGGNGLEDFFRKNFPLAECILDFWHASDHLTELGLALYADDETERQKQVGAWCHQLKHEGGATTLAALEAFDLTNHSPAARQVHADCVRYFRNHQKRMDYPRYLANGWQIGSGPVESGCKTVVGNRLKGSGMRWGEEGSDSVCHLRALFLSEPDQWDAFWKIYPN